MSIDNCQKCDERLDTDFAEYQAGGSLLCDGCLDDLEAKPETDWKAIAGELAESLSSIVGMHSVRRVNREMHAEAMAALAKYEQEKGV
jgi:hypothetical protein